MTTNHATTTIRKPRLTGVSGWSTLNHMTKTPLLRNTSAPLPNELDQFEAIEVTGADLRCGMILLDDLDTAELVLSRKCSTKGGTGFARFHVLGIDTSWMTGRKGECRGGRRSFSESATFRVAAK